LTQDEETPHGLVGAFQIKIRTHGDLLGMQFEETSRGLMVLGVQPGPLKTHNVLSSDLQHVYRHDFVVRVNEKSDVKDMVNCIDTKYSLKMDMFHPEPLRVILDTRQGPLGLELFAIEEDSTVIEIKTISVGVVRTYNEKCDPRRRVEEGDLVWRVNDVCEDQMAIFRQMNSKALLQIDLFRVKSRFNEKKSPEKGSSTPSSPGSADGESKSRSWWRRN